MPRPTLVFLNPGAKPPPANTLIATEFCKRSECKENIKLVKKDQYTTPQIRIVSASGPPRELKGDINVARYLARVSHCYGSDDFTTSQMDRFVDIAIDDLQGQEELADHCEILNHHLTMRTFFVGQDFSIADMTIWAALKGNPRWTSLRKNVDSFGHLIRWFNFCEETSEFIEAKKLMIPRHVAKCRWKVQISDWRKVKEVPIHAEPNTKSKNLGKLDIKDRIDEIGRDATGKWIQHNRGWSPLYIGKVSTLGVVAGGSWDIKLKGEWQGKVVTRFPPEPSGYLHIGHCKAVFLNSEIARQYGGKMIVRFDDTNPTKEKGEYAESIKKDLKRLEVKIDHFSHTSDHFPFLMDVCTDMIKRHVAYVDGSPREELKEQRMEGVENEYRHQTVAENLSLWEEMKSASEDGLKCCVRAKMDMSAKNKSLCDPVIYRCNLTPHIKTGVKYKVYPTYDFCCPVVDSLEGVTHALRTTEYHDRNAQYDWMFKLALGQKDEYKLSKIWGFSRLNFQFTLMSKRKLQWFVDKKLVNGWHDPRMPTIQGLLNRGLTVDAMREFVYAMATSRNVTLMEWDILWTKNKKIIDPEVGRYTAISRKGVPFHLRDGPELCARSIQFHPKRPELGNNVILFNSDILVEPEDAESFNDNEEITLLNWGNAIVETRIVDEESKEVVRLEGKLKLDGDVSKTDKKISWIADAQQDFDFCKVNLVDLGHLITVKKLTEDMKLEDAVNQNSWSQEEAYAEPAVRNLPKGTIIQFQRRGYFIVFDVSLENDTPITLIKIPDGRNE